MAEIKKISTELQLLDKFLDTSGDAGTSGQVLTSTGTGINWVSGGSLPGGPYLPLTAGSTKPLTGILYAGQGVKFTGGTIASATTVLHTNNVVYARGGSSGMFLQNADGSDGMFIANDYIRFDTSSTERMRITSAGNVGIGTSLPYDSSWGGNSKQLTISGTDYGVLNLIDAGGPTKFAIGAGDGKLYLAYDDVASEHRIVVDSVGNVGIGTTSPTDYYPGADNLVIKQASGEGGMSIVTANDTSGAIYFADGTTGSEQYRGGIGYTHSTDKLFLVSGGQTRAWMDTNGNVGIGTTNPSAFDTTATKLHVKNGGSSG